MQFYFSDFKNFLSYEKRYSQQTLIAYISDFQQFKKYLELNGVLSAQEVDPKRIRQWTAQLMNDGISPRSIRRKISVLNTYFKFLKSNNLIEINPAHNTTLPKFSKKLPVYVEENSMTELFNIPRPNKETWQQSRDLLIIEILYSTGIRLSELINLQENSIDLSRKQIKVLGKRNKERLIPFSKVLEQSIINYLNLKQKSLKQGSKTFLFLTNKGNKLYPKFVYRLVNSYLNKVSTIKKKSPHVLRHTFATHMLNNGADLNAIKELLGHVNFSATEIYTHNTIAKLKLIHQQSHPKG